MRYVRVASVCGGLERERAVTGARRIKCRLTGPCPRSHAKSAYKCTVFGCCSPHRRRSGGGRRSTSADLGHDVAISFHENAFSSRDGDGSVRELTSSGAYRHHGVETEYEDLAVYHNLTECGRTHSCMRSGSLTWPGVISCPR